MGALTHNGEIMQGLPANASQINFDKTGTDLNATQTEAAIKEVNGKVNTNAEDITQLKSGLTNINNIIINRKNVVNGDKIPWVSFASGLIIWSAPGMASGSGIIFVGADNTAITYTSLTHAWNNDISVSDFDFANGELEFKRNFIQVVIVKLTNA